MINLINCAECGQQVSSQAQLCPHCGKGPNSIKCFLCNNWGKGSEMASGTGYPIHISCFNNFVSQHSDISSFNCVACNKFATYASLNLSNYPRPTSCMQCGQPFTFRPCSFCGEQKVNFGISEYDGVIYHGSCKSLVDTIVEAKQKRQSRGPRTEDAFSKAGEILKYGIFSAVTLYPIVSMAGCFLRTRKNPGPDNPDSFTSMTHEALFISLFIIGISIFKAIQTISHARK